MFISHIPSGYIMVVSLIQRLKKYPVSAKLITWIGAVGALAPDIDMIYFYLIDHRQTHHHKYISHWPIFWLVLSVAFALSYRFSQKSKIIFISLIFCLGGVLHVILDSFVGDIWWFAPFIDKPYAVFTVQAIFKPWWLNFFLHWSFAMELLICVWAFILYRRRSEKLLKPDFTDN
jgi:hypothetical protein